MRYGEADRILHLLTPRMGRVSAIAKGVRRTRSRFGARLEPFFKVELLLHEGRSDLYTVTAADTVTAHATLRTHGACLDAASRACRATPTSTPTTCWSTSWRCSTRGPRSPAWPTCSRSG